MCVHDKDARLVGEGGGEVADVKYSGLPGNDDYSSVSSMQACDTVGLCASRRSKGAPTLRLPRFGIWREPPGVRLSPASTDLEVGKREGDGGG